MLAQKTLHSPLGPLRLLATSDALVGVYLPAQDGIVARAQSVERHELLDHATGELQRYFEGHRRPFTTPLALEGTEFQRSVWRILLTIPYGETRSYSWLARQLGQPTACRAVGGANARNALSIFIPCHRVVGATGHLTGYAGGIAAKTWLLEHERGVVARGAGPTAGVVMDGMECGEAPLRIGRPEEGFRFPLRPPSRPSPAAADHCAQGQNTLRVP